MEAGSSLVRKRDCSPPQWLILSGSKYRASKRKGWWGYFAKGACDRQLRLGCMQNARVGRADKITLWTTLYGPPSCVACSSGTRRERTVSTTNFEASSRQVSETCGREGIGSSRTDIEESRNDFGPWRRLSRTTVSRRASRLEDAPFQFARCGASCGIAQRRQGVAIPLGFTMGHFLSRVRGPSKR